MDGPFPGESPRAVVSEQTAEIEGSLFMAAMTQTQTEKGR